MVLAPYFQEDIRENHNRQQGMTLRYDHIG